MIEITIDDAPNDEFLGRLRPVFIIKDFVGQDFADYQPLAKEILLSHPDEQVVIVRNESAFCSTNKLALALFVESCHTYNRVENIVFKVQNAPAVLAAYKPYVALSVGLKYVMRILPEEPKMIYKEISLLSYLGLDIQRDYLRNKMFISLTGTEPARQMHGSTTDDALIIIGMLKSLALAKTGATINAELDISAEPVRLSEDEIIKRVVSGVAEWING